MSITFETILSNWWWLVPLDFIVTTFLIGLAFRLKFNQNRNEQKSKTGNKLNIGLFHPYANDGGGGERVLWCIVQALGDHYEASKVTITIYSGDSLSKQNTIDHVKSRFGITLSDTIDLQFTQLNYRKYVEAQRYPRFTMLFQSLGSLLMGFEAINKNNPDVMIDTMGYAFTYPVFAWLGGCKVGCYVHYPTISTDMLNQVRERRPSVINDSSIGNSALSTNLKLIYYHLFAWMYAWVGRFSGVVMTNSSWTRGHIDSLFGITSTVVYPPCNTTEFSQFTLEEREEKLIISVAQFRPEKDHALQVVAFSELIGRLKEAGEQEDELPRLVMIGSCRNEGDQAIIDGVNAKAKELGVDQHIELAINASFDQLKEYLSSASVGLHTMWNEHFGIGVVELMAAGVITIAHNSGGPKMDIVVPAATDDADQQSVGFLAATATEYADAMEMALGMDGQQRLAMQQRARERSGKMFSEEEFGTRVLDVLVGWIGDEGKKEK